MNKKFKIYGQLRSISEIAEMIQDSTTFLDKVKNDLYNLPDTQKLELYKNIEKNKGFFNNSLWNTNNEYDKQRQNYLSNEINKSFPAVRKQDNVRIDVLNQGYFEHNGLKYTITGFDEIKKYINYETNKLWNFILTNLNDRIFTFRLSDYMEYKGVKDRKRARELLKKQIKIISALTHVQHDSKKATVSEWLYTIRSEWSRGIFKVECNSQYYEGLKNTFMYVPKSLPKIKNPNAYLLGMYIYTYAKINNAANGKLNNRKCIENTNISLKVKNREYKKIIEEPFNEAIDILNETQGINLHVWFDKDDYTNIKDLLNGYLKYSIIHDGIKADYTIKKVSKATKKNIDSKTDRIKKAKNYFQQDKNINEIANLMGISERTVRSYLKAK